MKYYSIKHVATKGIVEFEGDEPEASDKFVRQTDADTKREGNWFPRFEKFGRDCFSDIGEARSAAIKKLKHKRESLSKQSCKVTDMIGKLVAEDTKL